MLVYSYIQECCKAVHWMSCANVIDLWRCKVDRTHTSPRGFTTQHLIKMSSFVRATVESCPLSGGCIVTDGAYELESSARDVFGYQFSPLLKFCFIICLQDFNFQKFLLEVRISSNSSWEIIHKLDLILLYVW